MDIEPKVKKQVRFAIDSKNYAQIPEPAKEM